MSKKKLWLVSIFSFLLIAMIATACGPAAPTATEVAATTASEVSAPAATEESAPAEAATAEVVEEAGKSILQVAYTREIDVLNAFTSQNLCDIEFTMVEGLILTDDNNTYIPVLAKEIPTFENGGIVDNGDGTYDMTWNLHENVKWHDGEPLTSKDVCFTWEFVSAEGSETYNRDEYLGITDCKMPDDNTVVFTWDGLYGYYAGIFEAILPEHILGGMTIPEIINYEGYNRSPVGTGPFKFAEWKSGEYIRVVKNENYWRGDQYPMVDEIVFSFIPDDNTRLNALKSGQYDIGEILPVQVKDMQSVDGFNVELINSNVFYHFETNVNSDKGKFMFGDVNVRRALYHAIDRNAIADQLMEGTVTVANSPINPSSPYYNPDVPVYDYDVALAKQLLDDAGWVPGSDGIRVKDGQRFSFVMLNRAGRTDRIAIAQVIQAQLKEVGVEVTFDTLESAAWTSQWRSGDWEAVVSGWFLPSDPSFTGIYACDGPNNMTGYCDPELDKIMEASDKDFNFEVRKPLLDEAQVLLAEDAFSLPIYYSVTPYAVSDRLGNFKGSGTNFGSFWNVYEWTLD